MDQLTEDLAKASLSAGDKRKRGEILQSDEEESDEEESDEDDDVVITGDSHSKSKLEAASRFLKFCFENRLLGTTFEELGSQFDGVPLKVYHVQFRQDETKEALAEEILSIARNITNQSANDIISHCRKQFNSDTNQAEISNQPYPIKDCRPLKHKRMDKKTQNIQELLDNRKEQFERRDSGNSQGTKRSLSEREDGMSQHEDESNQDMEEDDDNKQFFPPTMLKMNANGEPCWFCVAKYLAEHYSRRYDGEKWFAHKSAIEQVVKQHNLKAEGRDSADPTEVAAKLMGFDTIVESIWGSWTWTVEQHEDFKQTHPWPGSCEPTSYYNKPEMSERLNTEWLKALKTTLMNNNLVVLLTTNKKVPYNINAKDWDCNTTDDPTFHWHYMLVTGYTDKGFFCLKDPENGNEILYGNFWCEKDYPSELTLYYEDETVAGQAWIAEAIHTKSPFPESLSEPVQFDTNEEGEDLTEVYAERQLQEEPSRINDDQNVSVEGEADDMIRLPGESFKRIEFEKLVHGDRPKDKGAKANQIVNVLEQEHRNTERGAEFSSQGRKQMFFGYMLDEDKELTGMVVEKLLNRAFRNAAKKVNPGEINIGLFKRAAQAVGANLKYKIDENTIETLATKALPTYKREAHNETPSKQSEQGGEKQINYTELVKGKTVDLHSRNIKDEGCIELANALRGNTTVETLNIRNNSIVNSGYVKLIERICEPDSCTALKELMGIPLGEYRKLIKDELKTHYMHFEKFAITDKQFANSENRQILKWIHDLASKEAAAAAEGNRNVENSNLDTTIQKQIEDESEYITISVLNPVCAGPFVKKVEGHDKQIRYEFVNTNNKQVLAILTHMKFDNLIRELRKIQPDCNWAIENTIQFALDLVNVGWDTFWYTDRLEMVPPKKRPAQQVMADPKKQRRKSKKQNDTMVTETYDDDQWVKQWQTRSDEYHYYDYDDSLGRIWKFETKPYENTCAFMKEAFAFLVLADDLLLTAFELHELDESEKLSTECWFLQQDIEKTIKRITQDLPDDTVWYPFQEELLQFCEQCYDSKYKSLQDQKTKIECKIPKTTVQTMVDESTELIRDSSIFIKDSTRRTPWSKNRENLRYPLQILLGVKTDTPGHYVSRTRTSSYLIHQSNDANIVLLNMAGSARYDERAHTALKNIDLKIKMQKQINDNGNTSEVTVSLMSVLVQWGDNSGGHYVNYVRYHDDWYLIDSFKSNPDPVKKNRIKDGKLNLRSDDRPYLLVYADPTKFEPLKQPQCIKFKGLTNSCWVDSIVQLLYRCFWPIKQFKDQLNQNKETGDGLAEALHELFTQVNKAQHKLFIEVDESKTGTLQSRLEALMVKDTDAKNAEDGQHDATELLRMFFEEFFKNNNQEKYVITKISGGIAAVQTLAPYLQPELQATEGKEMFKTYSEAEFILSCKIEEPVETVAEPPDTHDVQDVPVLIDQQTNNIPEKKTTSPGVSPGKSTQSSKVNGDMGPPPEPTRQEKAFKIQRGAIKTKIQLFKMVISKKEKKLAALTQELTNLYSVSSEDASQSTGQSTAGSTTTANTAMMTKQIKRLESAVAKTKDDANRREEIIGEMAKLNREIKELNTQLGTQNELLRQLQTLHQDMKPDPRSSSLAGYYNGDDNRDGNVTVWVKGGESERSPDQDHAAAEPPFDVPPLSQPPSNSPQWEKANASWSKRAYSEDNTCALYRSNNASHRYLVLHTKAKTAKDLPDIIKGETVRTAKKNPALHLESITECNTKDDEAIVNQTWIYL